MKKFFWLLAGLAAGLAAGCSDDANEGGGTDGPAPIPEPKPLSQLTARRLKIRINGENGKYFAHTLNNTVVAPPRMLIAFLENNLQADGSVKIPEVLQPYMGGMKVIEKK